MKDIVSQIVEVNLYPENKNIFLIVNLQFINRMGINILYDVESKLVVGEKLVNKFEISKSDKLDIKRLLNVFCKESVYEANNHINELKNICLRKTN